MELALQCGWGMMQLNCALVGRWGGGTVILSPRDKTPDQVRRHAGDVQRGGGSVLLDPQFFLPHADHERLRSHEFWPPEYETSAFWSGPALAQLVASLGALNREIGTRGFIVPGMLAARVDADWLYCQNAAIDATRALDIGLPLYQTIALSEDAMKDENQVHEVLEGADNWRANGYYLVIEHPRGEYLVDDPNWMVNTLDLVAGLRLRGAEVILGYSTHQLLASAVADATMLASGTWMNVRSFPPEKFRVPDEEEQRRNATWYYCPQALSEYKIAYLDVAFEAGVLNAMAPAPEMTSPDAAMLFSGVRPSSVPFRQSPEAFSHYLQCLRVQASVQRMGTFDETYSAQMRMLDSAEALLETLRRAGVLGQKREFTPIIDTNRSALARFQARRGTILRRHWGTL